MFVKRLIMVLSFVSAVLLYSVSSGETSVLARDQGEQAVDLTVSGVIEVLYADNFKDSEQTLITLVTDDGTRYPLMLNDAQRAALGGMGGMRDAHARITFARVPAIEADGLHTAAQPTSLSRIDNMSPRIVAGNHAWLNVLCKFSDVSTTSATSTQIGTLLDNAFPRMADYFRAQSNNAVNITHVDLNWVSTAHPVSYYLNGPFPFTNRLFNDCTAAVSGSVNFSGYYGLNLFFNAPISSVGFAIGGSYCTTLSGLNKCWPVTYMPMTDGINGWPTWLAHEMGHAYGFPHSNNSNNDANPYDNYWDVMSSSWQVCASDTVFGCYPPYTNIYHRDLDGWIAAANKFNVPLGVNTITLDSPGKTNSPNYYTAIIPISGTRWIMLEARRNTDGGYEKSLPSAGVLIYSIDTSRSEPAWLVGGVSNVSVVNGTATWSPGRTYIDYGNNFSVSVNTATTDGYQVTLRRGNFPGVAPNLTVSVAKNADPVANTVVYTVSVANTGGTATGVVLAGALGTLLTYKDAAPNNVCTGANGWAFGREFRCAVGTLAGGQSFTTTVTAGTSGNGVGTMVATVFADQQDANPADDTASLTTTFTNALPDMGVQLSVDKATAGLNEKLTYTVQVLNSGSQANSVSFNIVLPDTLTSVYWWWWYNNGAYNCSGVGYTFTCTGVNIAAYSSLKLTLTGLTTTSGVVTVTGAVSVNGSGDADNSNNSVTVQTSVNGPPTTATNTPSPTATPTNTITPSATPPLRNPDTIGIFRPSTATFYLRGSNTQGFADLTVQYGNTNSYPVVGDWTGAGVTTLGVFDPTNGQFQLRNSNTPGPADETFVLGIAGDQPFAGRWQAGAAHDGVGVFRPSNGLIYLKNSLGSGFADYTMVLGIPGDVGVAGDWDGNGVSSPGVFRPDIVTFYLSDQVVNGSVFGDHAVTLGYPGDTPFAGDWTAQGHAGVGVFRPTNGLLYLKNDLSTGFADVNIVYGIPNDFPVAGHWGISSPAPHNSVIVPNTAVPAAATATPTYPSIRLTQPGSSYDG